MKRAYNSDWFKIMASPEITESGKGIKKSDMVAKVLITSQSTARSRDDSDFEIINQEKIEGSSSNDCAEDEYYIQEGLNTLLCNTVSTGKTKMS